MRDETSRPPAFIDPRLEALFRQLDPVQQISAVPNADERTNIAWERLSARTVFQSPSRPLRRRSRSILIGTMATLGVLIGVGVWRLQNKAPATTQGVDRMYRSTYTTGVAERMRVMLPDGNQAILAPQTRVSIRGSIVTLVGEAYFSVTHHASTPFIVRTATADTRVLGTTFDIRAYPSDSHTRVVVTEGKVTSGVTHRVTSNVRRNATILAGQLALVSDSTLTIILSSDVSQYSSWTTGRLDFRRTPAREVLDALGHWYGLQFQLADTVLANERIDVRFEGQAVQDVLLALRTLLHVKMTFGTTAEGKSLVMLVPDRDPSPTGHRIRAIPDSFSTLSREVGR